MDGAKNDIYRLSELISLCATTLRLLATDGQFNGQDRQAEELAKELDRIAGEMHEIAMLTAPPFK